MKQNIHVHLSFSLSLSSPSPCFQCTYSYICMCTLLHTHNAKALSGQCWLYPTATVPISLWQIINQLLAVDYPWEHWAHKSTDHVATCTCTCVSHSVQSLALLTGVGDIRYSLNSGGGGG